MGGRRLSSSILETAKSEAALVFVSGGGGGCTNKLSKIQTSLSVGTISINELRNHGFENDSEIKRGKFDSIFLSIKHILVNFCSIYNPHKLNIPKYNGHFLCCP